MPINLGYTKTGNTWPGELEVSRLDAPAETLVVDPSLPILATDPRFDHDKVVIGRGRLVGITPNASVSGSDITTPTPHTSYITLADGVGVRPLGYASHAIVKDWATKAYGDRPEICRNYMIALPYVASINGAYGALKQGDPVTAYFGSKSASYGDPRYKGAVCKWVGKQITSVAVAGTAGLTLAYTTYYSGITPRVIARFNSSGAKQSTASNAVAAGATGWTVAACDDGDTLLVEWGQGPEMIAGEVWGMESLNDFPGFMKWVSTNFGAWQLPPTYYQLGNSAAATDHALEALTASVAALDVANGAVNPVRIDASKPISVKVATGQTVHLLIDGVWTEYGEGTTLPAAGFAGADYTQGAHYTINPVTGAVTFFGVASAATGAPFGTASALAAAFVVNCSLENLQPEPAFGQGLYGLTDGVAGHEGTPLQLTRDEINRALASIGVMRVAIK